MNDESYVSRAQISKSVGRAIRKWRKAHNLSTNELASRLHISPSFLGLSERGRRGLGLEKIIHFKRMSGLSYDELFDFDNTSDKHKSYQDELETLLVQTKSLDDKGIRLLQKFAFFINDAQQYAKYDQITDIMGQLLNVLEDE